VVEWLVDVHSTHFVLNSIFHVKVSILFYLVFNPLDFAAAVSSTTKRQVNHLNITR
jgi:hypothetical protein